MKVKKKKFKDSKSYITNILSNIEAKDKNLLKEITTEIIDCAKRNMFLYEKSPKTKAVAACYVSTVLCGDNVYMWKFCQKSDIVETTLSKALKEIKEKMLFRVYL
ncbi:MAG: hypothetical protein JW700_00910 [Candidatus Aenigmarchaeota archaeon]|nr:hypothetical protein [Candidatus Aenigmarchaeota archaeon]